MLYVYEQLLSLVCKYLFTIHMHYTYMLHVSDRIAFTLISHTAIDLVKTCFCLASSRAAALASSPDSPHFSEYEGRS